MAQTSYAINLPAVAYPGQPADISKVDDNVSALAVAAAIPYGLLVVRDASNSSGPWNVAGKLPASAAAITAAGSALGVSVADQARAQDPSVAVPTYPQHAAVPCKRVGRIWVQVEDSATAGAQCYVRFASSVNGTQLGAFRSDADTISSVDKAAALPNAYYVTSQASAGGYALVELMLN
jgi:hypothetical protein